MSKILKNNTASPINITDTGVTVPASSQYTIPPQDYSSFAASSDVITELSNVNLTLNDGSSDITNLSDAVDIIKGWFPGTGSSQGFFFDYDNLASGDLPITLISTTGQAMKLSHLEVSCRIEATFQVYLNGDVIAILKTGAGKPSSSFTWFPQRPCLDSDLVEVTLTKRSGTPDVSAGAHLMGVST